MDNSRLLFYALGIFVCYFYYGVLQERITKGKYFTTEPDAEPEPFKYSLSLVLTTCFINYLFAKVRSFYHPLYLYYLKTILFHDLY
jgi:solute carrier family 35 (UDP-galactose transporter), member B1